MKKIGALLGVMFLLAGCGGNGNSTPANSTPSNSTNVPSSSTSTSTSSSTSTSTSSSTSTSTSSSTSSSTSTSTSSSTSSSTSTSTSSSTSTSTSSSTSTSTSSSTTNPNPVETVTGEAYGLTHGAGYVSRASVTVAGDKIKAATLVEVCFPTQVEATNTVPAEDKVVTSVDNHGTPAEKTFYKTVKFADFVLTYDVEAKDYVDADGNTFKALMANENNAKAYFDAVVANAVAVVVNGEDKTDVLNNASLNKELNGYWTVDGASKWLANRDATLEFLLENGIEALMATTKDAETKLWGTEDAASGATWTDLNSNTTGKGYLSYAKLLENAYIDATLPVTGEAYGLTHGAGYVSRASVTVTGDKIVDATLVEVCFPTYVQATEEVPAEDKVVATVVDHGSEVEKTFYKTVKFADFVLTYDVEVNSYVDAEGATFAELMADEANAKAYYDAVVANAVAVVVNGEDKTDVLNNASLNKEVNGYWTVDGASKWLANRDATLEFLLENGIEALMATTKDAETKLWGTEDAVSGATWTDMNSNPENGFSYAEVLENAYNNTNKIASGEAYGLTHGAGYVSRASVTMKGLTIVDATLVEVCFPAYVQATEEVPAEDKVVATVVDHGSEVEKTFYKTVKFADFVLTYDAEVKNYVDAEGATFAELMAVEANAKAYFDAVVANAVAVVVAGEDKVNVLNNASLNKEVNGYWTVDGASKWLANRDATIEFLLANGIDALMATVKDAETKLWGTEDAVSGATWTDMNSNPENGFSYAEVLENAFNAAK